MTHTKPEKLSNNEESGVGEVNEAHCKGKIVWSLPVTGGAEREKGTGVKG